MRQLSELFLLCKLNREIERRLNGHLIGRNPVSPGDSNAGKGFRDKETIPGTKLPGPFRMQIESTYSSVRQFRQLSYASLGDQGRTAWAIGGDGTVVTFKIGTVKVAQTGGSVAGAGAANRNESKTLDRASNKFAIEAATDKDGDAVVAKAPGAGQQATMPKRIDERGLGIVAGGGPGFADIAITQRNAEATDGHARDAWNDGESQTLLQGVGGGH
jgi:hypothetical protein